MSQAGKRSVATLLILWCLAWQPGCTPPGTPERPNIIFISIDTLRADRLGTYGYFRDTSPVLDALAAESILFERVFAPMATTFPSHLSLFTGTYPNETGAFANVGVGGHAFQPTQYLRTFAQFLQDDGYQTAAFVSATPLKRVSGISAGFDDFLEPAAESRRAEATNAKVFEWLEQKDDQRFFLWVHYFDPHRPYNPPAPFAGKYKSGAELTSYLEERVFAPAGNNVVVTDVVNNRYDGEVSYVDTQIGVLLEALRSQAHDWENTIVVVVSDHGEGLRQHGELAHGSVWNEQLHVALMMRVPGQAPKRVDRLMSVADVIPTLFGLTELPGKDAFVRQATGIDRLASEPGTTLIFGQESSAPWKVGPDEAGPRYLLTGDEWKYVFEPNEINGEARLYQLSTDPHELVNVSEQYPEITKRLHAILLQRLEEQETRLALYRATSEATDGEVDPEILEQLRSLGYVK